MKSGRSDEHSLLHHPKNSSARDPRGTRAPLWLEGRVRRVEPEISGPLVGKAAIGGNGLISSFLDDSLGGSLEGNGFLVAYEVLSGEVRGARNCAITLSVDGTQDNTQTLMHFAVDQMYRDRHCHGNNNVDDTLPMSILACMATHTIGSIPNLPTIKSLLATPGAKKCLEAGKCAGSLGGISDDMKEVCDPENTNNDGEKFRFHIGEFLAKAAAACEAFLGNRRAEESSRCGVRLWNQAVVSVPNTKGTFTTCGFAHERLAQPLPTPREFGCDSRVLSKAGTTGASTSAAELVSLGTYPCLEVSFRFLFFILEYD